MPISDEKRKGQEDYAVAMAIMKEYFNNKGHPLAGCPLLLEIAGFFLPGSLPLLFCEVVRIGRDRLRF